MLNALDDFPIHQTPEPLAHHASSDRNVYDRTWFNGYTADGSAYFGIGIAIYPHRRVMRTAPASWSEVAASTASTGHAWLRSNEPSYRRTVPAGDPR
ncbi:MAG: hypothetical protein R2705_05145 [Ilumatobacteraceae bacterium]